MLILPIESFVDHFGGAVHSLGLIARNRIREFFAGCEAIPVSRTSHTVLNDYLMIPVGFPFHREHAFSRAQDMQLHFVGQRSPDTKSAPVVAQPNRSKVTH